VLKNLDGEKLVKN